MSFIKVSKTILTREKENGSDLCLARSFTTQKHIQIKVDRVYRIDSGVIQTIQLRTISVEQCIACMLPQRGECECGVFLPGMILEMYIGEFCSLPPITLNPRPSSVFGSSTTRGCACPSLAANAATVALAVADALISGLPCTSTVS